MLDFLSSGMEMEFIIKLMKRSLVILLFLICGCVTKKPVNIVRFDNSNYLVKSGTEIWTVKAIYIENRAILIGNQIFK